MTEAGIGAGPTPPQKPNIPTHELDALRDLYDATQGEHWRWFDFNVSLGIPWNFTGHPNPCDPLWQGILCTLVPVNGHYNVIALDLQMHELRGTVPASFFNLTQLHGFSLATNMLFGSIPSTVGQLKLAQVADFSNNYFNGHIPKELGDCTSLDGLYLYNNNLNGTLPSEIGNLVKLRVLKVTLNRLTGQLPESLGQLKRVELLYMGRNKFAGTIPASYGNMGNVSSFLLYQNLLTGTLPASLAGLHNVTSMSLEENQLAGTIPNFVGNLSNLVYLYLNDNKFTGTIPQALERLPRLENLYLHHNLLSGSIPAFLGGMPTLRSIELSYNNIHHTIPAAIFGLPQLGVLVLSGNHLTGTVPAQLGNMGTLTTLELAHNHFTGTIPSSLGNLKNLTNLYLYLNSLHGTVPPELGSLPVMIFMYLDDNHLSGSLPKELSQLGVLTSFFFEKNRLTGPLDGVFNATRQPYLTLIQVGHNQLTGTLPDSIFALPQLKTLVLVGNCFHGTIPQSICACETLATLSLDGIHSASSCQNVMLPGISTSYVLTSKVPGGVPTCLFELPSLNTLHLSGNGLTGSLPENLNISEKLIDLALSHNKLTGGIPRVIQKRKWYNLDLSYNKFSGVLYNDIGSEARNASFEHTFSGPSRNHSIELHVPLPALSLRNNRLSDKIPSAVMEMANISLLYGNLFDCDLQETDLPEHDDGKSTYQCGSTSFDIPYYLWMASVLAAFLIAFSIYYWRHYVEPWLGGVFIAVVYIKRWLHIVTWYDHEHIRAKSRLHHYKYVMKVCQHMCRVAFWCTVFILCVMLPVYGGVSTSYGTHTYEYAWTVSAAFLSGYPALTVLLIFFMLLLALLLVLFKYSFRALRRYLHELPEDFHFSIHEEFVEETAVEQETTNHYSSWYQKAAIYLAFILINFIIVGGVNVAYVYVVIYEDSKYFTAAQIALSIFKLGWNSLGCVLLIRWTHHQIASSATKEWKSKGAGFFAIQLFVALFNFIAIPCLVVGAVSPNCFNNMVVDAPTVDSHYYYLECQLFSVDFGCLIYTPEVGTTSYSPPFTYSYECSSSLITYYAPSFVYMALIVTFVNPLLEVFFQKLHKLRRAGTWLGRQLDYVVPLVLQDVSAEHDASRPPYDIFNPYFDANLLLVNVVTYFGVLLTFGLVFPPLAVALLLAIYVAVYTSKLEVGRFITNSIDQNLDRYLDIIESECFGVGSIPKLRQCVAMLLVFTCAFYTPFLFDTLGDAVGVDNAAWVVVFLPLFPTLIYVGHMVYIYITRQFDVKKANRDRVVSVEMRKSEFLRSKRAADVLTNAMASEEGNGDTRPSSASIVSSNDSESGDAYTVNVLYGTRNPSPENSRTIHPLSNF
jgi:Leucine-rich repeat (LRR) protein